MKKLLFATLLSFGLSHFAMAANDLDSIGRSIKFLDYASPVLLSLYTTSCIRTSDPAAIAVLCVPITGADNEQFDVPNITEINVAAGSRSLIDLQIHTSVTYALRNATAARKTNTVSLLIAVTIESDALNDPGLINPRTGLPFGGKLENKYLLMSDMRTLEPGATNVLSVRPDFATSAGLLTRKDLMQTYGLNSTVARQVMSRALKVRLGVSGSGTGLTAVATTIGGRLISD